MSNEKDQTTAFELVRDYGGTDNAGLLRRQIEAALTTARKEARANERKALLAILQAEPATAAGADAFRKRVIEEMYRVAATQKDE